MKKRLLAVLLCLAMLASVVACGDNGANKEEVKYEGTAPTLEQLADYSNLDEVFKGDYAVTEDKLNEAFASILTQAGVGVNWSKVTDRDVVEENDIVYVDYTGYLNDKAFEGGTATGQLISVKGNANVDKTTGQTSGGFIEGFTAGLVGAKVGESVSYEVTFPKDYANADLKGKTVVFKFNVNSIQKFEQHTLSSVDDAFVKEKLNKNYGFNTVADAREHVTEGVTYNNLLKYLLDKSVFNIPEEYLVYRATEYVDYYLSYYNEMYEMYYGMSYEKYMKDTYGYTKEDMIKDTKDGIKSRIQEELVYNAIAAQNSLSYDESGIISSLKEELGKDYTEEKLAETLTEYYKDYGLGVESVGKDYVLNGRAANEFLREYLGYEVEEETTESTEK